MEDYKQSICCDIGIDPEITFGIEIESQGYESINIINLDEFYKGWKVNEEGSVTGGVEISSPILTNNEEDISNIYKVCENLKKMGQEISETCGGHIHIGANYLKNLESYKILTKLLINNEEILYLICNKKECIRPVVTKYAKSFRKLVNDSLKKGTVNLKDETEIDAFVEEIQQMQKATDPNSKLGIYDYARNFSFNFLNIGNEEKNTIEIRMPNGTLNAKDWIDNIRLFGKIFEVSNKLSKIFAKKDRTEDEENLINLFNEVRKNEKDKREKMLNLVNLLFKDDEIKKIYNDRFDENFKREENQDILKELGFHDEDEYIEIFNEKHNGIEI